MNASSKEIESFKNYISNTLGSARTLRYFQQQIQSIINDLGFSHFDYSIALKNRNFEFLLSSVPETLISTYKHEGLYKYDCFIEHITYIKRPAYQSEVDSFMMNKYHLSSERAENNKRILELIYHHGFLDGYCIPIQIKNSDELILFTVLSEGDSEKKFKVNIMAQQAKLYYLAHAIYSTSIKNFRSHFRYKPLLIGKEIQIIDCFAKHAKTADQVANLLCISKGTVNNYLEKIKVSLNADSIGQAICIAIDKGLISSDRNVSPNVE